MIKNYLKIALRNIKRHKGYSFINIAGLAIGMAVCILILLFVFHERSYDSYHERADHIYRIERELYRSDGSVYSHFCSIAPSFILYLEQEFSEMEHVIRMVDSGRTLVSLGDKHFIEERFYFAEHDIFEIFTIPLGQGDPETALREPANLVINESMARKYFGDEDPIGKQLRIGEESLFQITGVMKNMPENSHVHFDFLASYMTLKGVFGTGESDYYHGTRNFSDNVTYTYMRFAKGRSIVDITPRIPGFLNRHLGEERDEEGNIILASQGTNLIFRKLTDIHLHSNTANELEVNGDIRYVTLFTIIAVFVLIIACINFMNLSTARAAQRAKEVGFRKVVGANRRLLCMQFLGESLIMALVALILAFVFVGLLLSPFSEFSNRTLSLGMMLTPMGLLILIGVFLATGIASGFYPAIYLSAYRPANILRGELTRGTKGAKMRKALVVFQSAISIVLIVCVSIVFKQMSYLQNADLGYDRENIVMIPADRVIRGNWDEIKHNLVQSSYILSATMSKRAPTGRLGDAPGFSIQVKGEVLTNSFYMPHNRVEHDFFRTFGMKIIAGRDFSTEHPTDKSEAFILNETAVSQLGLENPEEAVGLPMAVFAPNLRGRVIGVVADFNYESMHHEIIPIVTYIRPQQANTVSLRVASGGIKEALNHAKGVWAHFHPEYPFRYDFLDSRIRELYRNEERMMQMFCYFSLLAILIACLGLFGLASFTAEQRTKEIGIRKVLGATLANIVFLLSREFTKHAYALCSSNHLM